MKNNIKFVYLKILAVSVILLSTLSSICVYGDTESKIEYNISYRTSVGVYCTAYNETYTKSTHIGEPFSKDYTVDVTDPTVTADINRCVNKYIPKIYSYHGFDTAISTVIFRDGHFYKLDTKNVRIFADYFGLPENFNGETVIVKDGVPLTVVGDGNGNLSFTVKPGGNKEVEKIMYVPPLYSHTVEEMLVRRFEATYRPLSASSNQYQHFSTDSLEKMLDHLEKNANPEYKVNISATVNYSYHVIGIISYKYEVDMTYYVADDTNSKPTSSNQSAASKNENTTSSEKPSSSANSSSASSAPSSSENSSDTSTENSTSDSQIDTFPTDESITENTDSSGEDVKESAVSSKKEDEKANKNIIPLKIIILIALVIIGGMIGYCCTALLKKQKNK